MDRTTLLTYGVPFVGAVLLAGGIGASVLGVYATVQAPAGLCGDPTLSVASAERTERLREGYPPGGGPTLERLRGAALSPAERRAVELALDSLDGEAAVEGRVPNRAAFRRGVLVAYDGGEYYTTLADENRCVAVSPLAVPLGLATVVLGVVGVLTPPLYRRYLAFERERGGG